MDTIELSGLPFPPSVNALYAGKTRRYKSDKAKDYDKAFDIWLFKNRGAVRSAESLVRELEHNQDIFLELTLDYVIPRKDLYTKKGTVKRIDVTNRIKSLLDKLAEAITIDDNRFFLGRVQFLLGPYKYVNIGINTTRIRGVNNGKKESNEKES